MSWTLFWTGAGIVLAGLLLVWEFARLRKRGKEKC